MALHLYNFTLQNPGAVTHAVGGNFNDSDSHQILVARGHILELLAFDGVRTLQSIVATEVFGVIRSLATFRLHGTTKDYAIVGSDSGKITIVEYSNERNAFVKVHEETFGRSGARRIVPGQYLATDPAGRAAMIGALEKQKFVYILNRDNQAKLTISSPLEAHKSHSVVFDLVGVDVGFANPIFASIEMDYAEADQDSTGVAAANAKKSLVWYELDLGLNHVVRKNSDLIDRTAHKLIAVPGGSDFPGGVIICAKSAIYYRNLSGTQLRATIPRRIHTLMTGENGEADDGVLIVAHTLYKHGTSFWFIFQTEHGDLFHVALQHQKEEVLAITAQYMDTVPPATELVLTGTFLHVFSEVGNQYMYNVIDVPNESENVTFEAKDPRADVANGNGKVNGATSMEVDGSEESSGVKLYFKPRALKYLVMLEDEVPSLSPILDLKVTQAKGEDSPKILALCGSGARSSLSMLKHGIQVDQKAKTTLEHAVGVWTLKTKGSIDFDQYIVVAFAQSTLVLTVGDSVQQITEDDPLFRSFLDTTTTLNIGRLADDTMVQIHPGGIRHIRSNLSNQELPCPSDRKVIHSTLNERQVALALNGANNNLIYYESDGASKLLAPHSFSVGGDILAIALQPVPLNRQRARFLAVAVADDKGSSKIVLYSLDPNELMQTLSVQIMPWRVSSLSLAFLDPPAQQQQQQQHHSTTAAASSNQLILGVGSVNGVFSRFQVDPNSGEISEGRDKALGNRPVKLFTIKMPNGATAMGATSSRPWVLYNHQSTLRMAPLSYPAFDTAFSFHSELCQHGIVCVTPGYLAIVAPQGYGRTFDHQKVPLSYTPRQSCVHPISGHLLIAESDHNADPIREREKLHSEMTTPNPNPEESPVLPETLFNAPKPGPKTWGSCVRLVELETGKTLDLISLDNNEAALSITTCSFREHSGEVFVCVGTAKDLVLQPKRSCSAAFIHVYSVIDQGRRLQLLHKKQVEDIPGALAMYDHRLLAGIGKSLKIYDLGKRNPQLLRKCENNGFPNHIVSISSTGDRIIVGDIQESVHYVKYSRPNLLTIIADDTTPRWITSVDVLDFDTVAGSDKFGNVFVLRLPEKVARVESDATGKASPWTSGAHGGAAHKLELMNAFHVGEIVTRVQKIRLTPGGAEFLLYATVYGTLGALIPLTSRGNVDFLSQLELFMRQENAPLCGRDHLAYRSAYFPVKNVVDGDLLEQFSALHPDKQRTISEQLEQSVADIQRKLEDIRSQL